MAKTIKLEPIDQETSVNTNDNLLSGLLSKNLNILSECGGRGMCSTCHVFIKDGMDHLSPLNRREQRTLEVITSCRTNSRLACQARVLGDGVVVELPTGVYIDANTNIEDLIGRRAEEDLLHPLTGKVLVEQGKLVTRSMISLLQDVQVQVNDYFAKTYDL